MTKFASSWAAKKIGPTGKGSGQTKSSFSHFRYDLITHLELLDRTTWQRGFQTEMPWFEESRWWQGTLSVANLSTRCLQGFVPLDRLKQLWQRPRTCQMYEGHVENIHYPQIIPPVSLQIQPRHQRWVLIDLHQCPSPRSSRFPELVLDEVSTIKVNSCCMCCLRKDIS